MITIKVKRFDGKDLKHECNKLNDYTVSSNGGDHYKVTNIHTGESFTGVNRECGFGLYHAIKKQAKAIGIIIIPIILIGTIIVNGGY
jgi:hypothetical protein